MTPNIQEPHQINVVTMDVSKNFYWRLKCLYNSRLRLKNIRTLVDELTERLTLLSERCKVRDLLLAFFRLQKLLYEKTEQTIIGVLLY